MLTLPNLLTFGRIVAIVPFVGAFWLDAPLGTWLALALFAGASLTDLLDGWIARARGQSSELGRVLDPIADKLLVAAALVLLVAEERASAIAAVLILSREFMISAAREWLAERRIALPVTRLAKLKTASQMTALALLLAAPLLPAAGATLGTGLLWLAVALTWITGAGYLGTTWHHLRDEERR